MSSMSSLLNALRRPFVKAPPEADPLCPICHAMAPYLDAVDFNKNCEEARGSQLLPKSGELVPYHLCDVCGFCFAPGLATWKKEVFEARIYNAQYAIVDPDYVSTRPRANADMVDQTFGSAKPSHIDYGGGSGLLSSVLRSRAWNSETYDPFVDKDRKVADLGRFDLVTAFEVFEHVPDVAALFADLDALVKPDGMILFSTLLSDGEIERGRPLTWWYASPRNGHISLFSKESMRRAVERQGFDSSSASANLHVAYRTIPSWAAHIWG